MAKRILSVTNLQWEYFTLNNPYRFIAHINQLDLSTKTSPLKHNIVSLFFTELWCLDCGWPHADHKNGRAIALCTHILYYANNE